MVVKGEGQHVIVLQVLGDLPHDDVDTAVLLRYVLSVCSASFLFDFFPPPPVPSLSPLVDSGNDHSHSNNAQTNRWTDRLGVLAGCCGEVYLPGVRGVLVWLGVTMVTRQVSMMRTFF